MFHTVRQCSSGHHRYLCLVIAYAMVLSLIAPIASAQAPLPAPSPGGTMSIPAPLSAPVHQAGPVVAPPSPPNELSGALLPSIDGVALSSVSPPPIPEDPNPNVSQPETVRHLQHPCDLDCGGADPPPGSGTDPDFSTARTRAQNETGEEGVDLGSRNFNWSLPLVGLQGRAGLDLNLALYYNSLVWTKQGNSIRFNSDRGFPGPGPGFILSLPKLQQRHLNEDFGAYAYMLVTPSGGRVELRQVSTTTTYESVDSSYMQLTDNSATKVLRTKDGTQYTFVPAQDGEFRCIEIKDRNGNYISATYNGNSDIATVTDTLGRTIQFNYDPANYLTSITQNWTSNGQPQIHEWATFDYTTIIIGTNFPGLFVQGPADNTEIPALSSVKLPDGSSYKFEYTSWGQVYQIRQNAADGHLRARTTYNLPRDASVVHSECPRFTERRDWAEYWMEVLTRYSADPGGAWTQVTQPNGTVHKEYFGTTDWQKGLTVRTEVYSADDLSNPKKWSTIDWTQDFTGLAYQLNPRPIETNTFDTAGNRRRTTIDYTSFGLPSAVREWTGAAGNALYRLISTGYRWDGDYLNRRIIGLVDNVQVTDGAGALISKTTYGYDWSGDDMFQDTPAPAVQHDRINYGPAFIYGRGNLSQVARWDVTDPQNAGKTSETKRRMNSTGSVLLVRDPLGHQTQLSYSDSFSDGVIRNTFAFPTTVTDADGFSSTAQYNYDFGAITQTQDPKGAVAVFTYDAIGRPERVTSQFNGAYTKWTYPSSQDSVNTFSTIQEGKGEAFSMQVFDGAGRVYRSVSALPGSTGGYSAQSFQYNSMGRLQYQSNPAEVNGTWVPVGDDAAGWRWTEQTYDYLGRPTVTINPDGTTREAIYGGCGCAGGEVVTMRDEAGRRRRLTADALGRQSKVEELNWDQSVYSTTNLAYNARDQITNITQQNDRARTFEYDGHGRLWRRTTPEQGATTFSYFKDDMIQTITDARGASQTFSYHGRHLPWRITYGVPSGVEPTPNVTFGYDEAGNRTLMLDGFGTVDYAYDTLSRLTSETRHFNGVGSYTLGYEYNLAGELTKITNPWSVQVGYNYNSVGQLTGMTGANYAGVNNYITSMSYRAFGGVKGINYGNGKSLSTAYDNRQRLTTFNVAGVLGYNYTYNNTYFNETTGRVSYAQNIYDATLDRSYQYDQVGRLVVAHSGAEARAHAINGQWGTQDGPFSQGYDYDPWGNITGRSGSGGWNASYSSATFNAKNQMTINPGHGTTMQYDAAGNMTHDGLQAFTYDAAGSQVQAPSYNITQGHDGDGLRVKNTDWGTTTYYLHSTVLGGQVVAELEGNGTWRRGYVYAGGQLVALQQYGEVNWAHQDPVNKSQRITNAAGTVIAGIELDPWGGATGRSWNNYRQPHEYTTYDRGQTGDESLFRRYHGWFSRFAQPDPYDGSYNSTDPQSFNRYAYVQNDPVNFVDPTGLDKMCRDVLTGEWFPCPDVDPRDNEYIYTNEPRDSLFDSYFLPASQGGGRSRGFFSGGLLPSPGNPQGPAAPQKPLDPTQQPSKPPCDHVGSGQADINFGRSKGGVGPTGGVQLTANKVHVYGGISVGVGLPPGGSASIMGRNGTDISAGLNYSFSAGSIVGFSYSGKLNPSSLRTIGSSLGNGSFMFGGTTPGVGASVIYVSRGWQIPCL